MTLRAASILTTLLLVGCSTSAPRSSSYSRADWASVSLDQAIAECRNDINREGGSPNMRLCLGAKGWKEQ